MSDPTIAAWSRESDLLFALRQLREENELLKTQREWQGLTDEEVVNRANAEVFAEAFARGVAWAELKLKEKNT